MSLFPAFGRRVLEITLRIKRAAGAVVLDVGGGYSSAVKLLFVQHGDFGAAVRRFQEGGEETYRDQQHTVGFVADLSDDFDVTIMAGCERVHDEVLKPRLRSIGLGATGLYARKTVIPMMNELEPDLIVCRTPNVHVLGWAAGSRRFVLPSFADTFSDDGSRGRLSQLRLGFELLRAPLPCVANHSLSASMSLRKLGIPDSLIVPWELRRVPPDAEPKEQPTEPPLRLFYAGALLESKGVGDVLDAVALLGIRGVQINFSVAGWGDVEVWKERAAQRGVSDKVHFLGRIPAHAVLDQMRSHHAVIVPSRHSYAEGLPNTVFEGLASRSPLVASDHPSFVKRLVHERDVLFFRAGDPASLAEQLERLVSDSDLFHRLSAGSATALAGLYVGTEWTEFVRLFLEDPRDATDWVKPRSLASLLAARPELDESGDKPLVWKTVGQLRNRVLEVLESH